jgi:small subunit ribosomal protein S3
MGQKVNPVGFRLGITRGWESTWFEKKKNYANYLHEDLWIREFVSKECAKAEISKIKIERPTSKMVKIKIATAKPGIVIGKKGAQVEAIKRKLKTKLNRDIFIDIVEIRTMETDAQLVANSIASQLERRGSYRRVMKQAMGRCMRLNPNGGIKIVCSGRLGGAEIARTERYMMGRVPLHTLRANIDYARGTAITSFGTIGVKVWIFKGEVLGDYRDKE